MMLFKTNLVNYQHKKHDTELRLRTPFSQLLGGTQMHCVNHRFTFAVSKCLFFFYLFRGQERLLSYNCHHLLPAYLIFAPALAAELITIMCPFMLY